MLNCRSLKFGIVITKKFRNKRDFEKGFLKANCHLPFAHKLPLVRCLFGYKISLSQDSSTNVFTSQMHRVVKKRSGIRQLLSLRFEFVCRQLKEGVQGVITSVIGHSCGHFDSSLPFFL